MITGKAVINLGTGDVQIGIARKTINKDSEPYGIIFVQHKPLKIGKKLPDRIGYADVSINIPNKKSCEIFMDTLQNYYNKKWGQL